jgi:hypothetical protein
MKTIIALLLVSVSTAFAQTHTLKGNNVVPSGSKITINSGGSLLLPALGTGLLKNTTGTGVLSIGAAGTDYEAALGNPGTNGFVLSSTTTGTRSWIAPGGGGGAPTTSKYILQTADGSLPNAQALGVLATGLLKSTTSTGVLSIGAAGTDYVAPGGALGTPSSGTLTNCTFPTLNQNTTGSAAKLTTPRNINGVAFDGTTGIITPPISTNGVMVQSNGTTWGASISTWPTTSGPAQYDVRSDGSNFNSYPDNIYASSTATVSGGYAADTYLAGSAATVTAGDFKAQGQYYCAFDMVKTAAGTAAIVISVRIGTAGTTSDTARMTFTFAAGTAATDTGTFEIWVNFRSVGSGTSAVIAGICRGTHGSAAAGLFSTTFVTTLIGTVSPGFDSSAATTIGISFNGGTSFSGTNTIVQTRLQQP